MVKDIRLTELLFLQQMARWTTSGQAEYFSIGHADLLALKMDQRYLIEMIVYLLEEGALIFLDMKQRLVRHLCGERVAFQGTDFHLHEWENPRDALRNLFLTDKAHQLVISYTGLRRIEELREQLRTERILDSLGVLLDWRYLHADVLVALARADQPPVSLIALDLDKFKAVNDGFGHDAGDAVLIGYMNVVKEVVGTFGTAFRRGGDEVRALLPGFTHERACAMAETIRAGVAAMTIPFQKRDLPRVTTSIGVATTPPDPRAPTLDQLADTRQTAAKKAGGDCVVSQ